MILIRRDDNKTTNDTHKDKYRKKSRDTHTIKIITDEPAQRVVLDFPQYSKVFSKLIVNSPPLFSIGIFGDWGTGKTTLMRMIRNELKDTDTNHEILTIWFDAWKYERDENLALVPLLKLLETELKNSQHESNWQIIKEGVKRTTIAFIESSKFNAGLGKYGSVETDLGTFIKSLKAGGSVDVGGRTVNYYSHPTDHLKLALEQLRTSRKGADKFRIVVFIDDLDRCTPENAVQVLESIKSFFAIEGIIYVIGMNVASIKNIIKAKYGEDSGVSAFDYMDKIVQLPFSIPNWNRGDLSRLIDQIQMYDLDDSTLVNALKTHRKIILGAVKNNPRDTKRFINDIIRAKAVFRSTSSGNSIPLDQLIAVQALSFRVEWHRFLEIITLDEHLKGTLGILASVLKKSESIDNKEIDKIKKSNPTIRDILDEYPSLFKESFPLRKFLDSGALSVLAYITDMEPLRRASSTTTPFRKQAASISDKYLFDYEVKYQGETEHFNVYYETSLTSTGASIAKGFLESCESNYDKVVSYFGGVTPPNLPFNVVISQTPPRGEGAMGAYHYGCQGTDIYVDIIEKDNPNLNVIQFLTTSQVVEVFSAALPLGWDCEKTSGEALSRCIATDLYPSENTRYTTAAYWLDSKDRKNFINDNKPAYEDLAALGCSVLFLNYLHYQLKLSWKEIIANGAPTLEETYTKLTASEDGFLQFRKLLDRHFPLEKQTSLTTDNPFPLE